MPGSFRDCMRRWPGYVNEQATTPVNSVSVEEDQMTLGCFDYLLVT